MASVIQKYFSLLSKIGLVLVFELSQILAKDFRGAELRTINTYLYGRFEARIQSAPHSGVVSSLFSYHELGGGGLDDWSEIDIEFLGQYTDRVQLNTITDGQVSHEHFVTLSYDPATEFHTYAFEWTPHYVAWFVDDIQIFLQNGSHINLINRYQKLMMNIWLPNYPGWVGSFDENDLPIYAFYDWVSYYAYVPGTGNAGTDNDFIQLWHDDFDSWDTNRWQKASHTWDGNNVDFVPENAVFQDGYLILCLTTPSALGYHGPSLGTRENQGQVPTQLNLSPAWPNPFNAYTHFTLETNTDINFEIHDIMGQLLQSRNIPSTGSTTRTLIWDGRNDRGDIQDSGVYFIRVNSPTKVMTRKVVMLK